MLANEAPNVVSRDGFRLLLDDGYQAIVVCEVDGEQKDSRWTGRWTIRALGGEGRTDYVLVSVGGDLRAREFKTALGVISFLHEMGFEIISIPFRQGGAVIQPRSEAAPDRNSQAAS